MATPLRDEVWRWPGSEPMAVTTDTVSTTVRRRLGLQEGTVRLEATLESFVVWWCVVLFWCGGVLCG
mgnify:CR=1 FL=1